MTTITLYTDACSTSSQPLLKQKEARWGWIALNAQHAIVSQRMGFLGCACDIYDAEATALIKGLEWCVEHGLSAACYSDDLPLVCHVNGTSPVLSARVRPFVERIQALLAEGGSTLAWVPRAQNLLANFVVNHGRVSERFRRWVLEQQGV